MSNQLDKTSGFGIGEAGKAPASTPLDELKAQLLQSRRQPDFPNGKKLACGCTVYYKSHVMSASMGTSCPNCYDDMSD